MKDATPEQVERNREFLKARAKDMNLAQADLVLEGPVEFKQIGTTQKDMEFLSLREFTRNEILAVYGVPPAMVSIIETGNIGSGTGDTQRQNFYEETVAPFQRRVAEKLTKQIIREGFGITDWAFEFNRRTIDEKQQADILNIYLANGVLRPDEVRPIVVASLPQIRKAMGVEDDELYKARSPGGPALRGRSDTITNATKVVVKLENSFLTSLKRLLGSFARRIEDGLPKLKMQELGDRARNIDPKFEEYVAAHNIMRFKGYRAPEVVKALPELEVLLEAIDQDRVAELLERFNLRLARKGLKVSSARSRVDTPDELSVELEELIRKNSIVVAANVTTSIKDSLRRELVEGLTRNETIPQLRDRIADKLKDFVTVQVKGATDDRGRVFQGPYTRSLSRADSAEIIARTEANRAYNLGTLDALEQNDVEEVTFLLAGDACPLCRAVSDSLPGTKIGKKFTLDEAKDIVPVHPNCFPGHTPVFTPEGWRKISQVRPGDKVLTHRLRFRKVARTFSHAHDGLMIRLAYHRSDWRGDVACTPNHRFLTPGGEWKEARELRPGDALLLLANRCGACGEPVPYWRSFCSKRCVATAKWRDPEHRRLVAEKARAQLLREYAEGKRDGGAIVLKAHAAVRRMVALGLFTPPAVREGDANAAKRPEVREKIRQSKLGAKNWMYGRKGPLHHLWRGGKVGYRGKDWDKTCRSVKERDGFRCMSCGLTEAESVRTMGAGLQVHHLIPFRVKPANEAKWLTTLCARCHAQIERVTDRLLHNDLHEYRTMEARLVDVESFQPKRPLRVYNLEVEEDESYIARGFIAHNCRCTWIVEG